MTEKDIHKKFSELVTAPRAAAKLGIAKQTLNNYRDRGASLGKQLEILFHADLLRFKDDWDE